MCDNAAIKRCPAQYWKKKNATMGVRQCHDVDGGRGGGETGEFRIRVGVESTTVTVTQCVTTVTRHSSADWWDILLPLA